MKTKKVIVGNWKMNPGSVLEALEILKEIISGSASLSGIKAVICAPAPFLQRLSLMSKQRVAIGAEDCSFVEGIGPYTGEVSARMLKSIGASYVILGHSERRAIGESDELINKKIKSAMSASLKVILCVGEKTRDESGEYLNLIKYQLTAGLDKVKKDSLKNLIIAYEPIWAIGKGASRPATPADVLEVSIFIKKILAEIFGYEYGIRVLVIYGGSVDANNSGEFLVAGKADGLLVGRESLNARNFIKILRIADNV